MASLQVGAAPPTAPAGNARIDTQGDADAWAAAVAAATGDAAGSESRAGRPAGSERGAITRRNGGRADEAPAVKDPRKTGQPERVRDDKHHAPPTSGTSIPLAVVPGQTALPGAPDAVQHAGAKASRVAAPGGKSRKPAAATDGAMQAGPEVNQRAVAAHAALAPQAGKDAPTKRQAWTEKSGAAAASAAAPEPLQAASAASVGGSRAPVPVDAVPAAAGAVAGDKSLPGSAAGNVKVAAVDAASPQLTFADLKKALPDGNAPQIQTAGVALGVLQVPVTAVGADAGQALGVATATTLSRSDVSANAQTLGSAVAALHQGGLNTATVHLTPPTLGSVQIQIQVAAGHAASVAFIVAQPAAAQAVQASLPLLAQALQQHGITLAQASVSTGDGGAPAWTGQPGGGGQQPSHGQPQQGALVGSGRRGREAAEVVVPKGVRAYA